MEPPKNVAIIGAGLAGMALAVALHRAGIPSTLYESRAESYDIGGGIMLSPNALRILDQLGVYKRVVGKGLEFDKLAFSDGDGTVHSWYYFGSREMYGYAALRIIRKELIAELQAMLREQGTPMHFNTSFKRIIAEDADGVEFELGDGTTKRATLLIGADGIHSTVRSHVAPGVSRSYVGMVGINATVARDALRLPPGFHLPATVMAKSGAFLMVPQGPQGAELMIGVQRRIPEPPSEGWSGLLADKKRLRSMMIENMDDWPDVVRSALEAAPEQSTGLWAFHTIPKLEEWASKQGRVVLIGDAAHAIPPTAGQGVNQAFEDASMLASLLAGLSPKAPLQDALSFWQKSRQDRVDRVLELNQQMNTRRMQSSEEGLDDDDWVSGANGQLAWLYQRNLEEDVAAWLKERQGNTGAERSTVE